ncbi:MAG: winged helix-turn-helix transcriptional regulator [Candidatus Bathyarchaeota archaeon]|nr:winged helix-turn-helix transcriptional regulator [Candidatus Bathyarchaeota archaeon]
MNTQLTLSAELRKLVEVRLEQTLKGIEDTLTQILEKQQLTPQELKAELKSLEESFTVLFQKWNLELLYTLTLKTTVGFSEFKKTLGINSRTLSDKLKLLKTHGYIGRTVDAGPPLRVEYALTRKGKNTVLLALPLLYYSSAT